MARRRPERLRPLPRFRSLSADANDTVDRDLCACPAGGRRTPAQQSAAVSKKKKKYRDNYNYIPNASRPDVFRGPT